MTPCVTQIFRKLDNWSPSACGGPRYITKYFILYWHMTFVTQWEQWTCARPRFLFPEENFPTSSQSLLPFPTCNRVWMSLSPIMLDAIDLLENFCSHKACDGWNSVSVSWGLRTTFHSSSKDHSRVKRPFYRQKCARLRRKIKEWLGELFLLIYRCPIKKMNEWLEQ